MDTQKPPRRRPHAGTAVPAHPGARRESRGTAPRTRGEHGGATAGNGAAWLPGANVPSGAAGFGQAELGDAEFARFQKLLFEQAGISLSPVKKALVSGRLARRLAHFELPGYAEYLRLLARPEHQGERQIMLDLLTTHETRFFREPQHFSYLAEAVLPRWRALRRPIRVWSAACSTGEEPYSVAMLLDDRLGEQGWDILGTDISAGVLETARLGQYPASRMPEIPREYLSRYCLKGVRSRAGTLLIDPKLRERVRFEQVNLAASLPDLGRFDLILLRNVMIYFDLPTKRQVVSRLVPRLERDGLLIVGHAETLNGVSSELVAERPTVYRQP